MKSKFFKCYVGNQKFDMEASYYNRQVTTYRIDMYIW